MQFDTPLRNVLAANVEQTMGVVEPLLSAIHSAGELVANCFLQDKKLMICSSSGATAIGQYLSSLLVGDFEYDRPGLPALALNSNNEAFGALNASGNQHELYARQVHALGHAGDVLLLFCANTNSAALVRSVIAAHDRQLRVVAITGSIDQDISAMLAPDDEEIHIPTSSRARLVEAHVLIAHCICELIEHKIFGMGELA